MVPRRHWRKILLGAGESIKLRPGEMILGRTFEAFSIPRSCAGKLEGRSSFARMGLAIHCSADFINPAWRGRMPLQLTNLGASSIRSCTLPTNLSADADQAFGRTTAHLRIA
jgi:deoxycytidine triphosphate deaminase